MKLLHGDNASEVWSLFQQDTASRPPAGDAHWDSIPPIWSGGQADRPRVALVFINPTYRNQAAREGWPAELRAPHIGFHRVWDFLTGCNLMPGLALPPDGAWTRYTAVQVSGAAADAQLYITNLVKACGTTSLMPPAKLAYQYRSLLVSELELVKPAAIICLGSLVTQVLTQKPFRIRDAYDHLRESGKPFRISTRLGDVYPSYFPSGRGEPGRARDIITAVAAQLDSVRKAGDLPGADQGGDARAHQEAGRVLSGPCQALSGCTRAWLAEDRLLAVLGQQSGLWYNPS